MCQEKPFTKQLEALYDRVEELKLQIADGDSKSLLEITLAELDTAMEELRVAEEELHIQAENLAASRLAEQTLYTHYHSMFQFAPDAYLVTDMQGKVQEANLAALQLLSLENVLLIGKLLVTFIKQEDRPAFRKALFHLWRNPEIVEWEMRMKPHQQGVFYASLRAGVEFDLSGTPLAIRWLIRDVTQHWKVLRQSEERYRLLVEGVQDHAIFMLDTEGRVTAWNTGAERILGFSEAEILGRSAAFVFVPEDQQRGLHLSEMETAVRQGSAVDERWHQRRDGSRFWGSGTLSALRDAFGKLYGFVKVMRDNTERQMAEEALRKSEERLRLVLDATQMGHWERNLQSGEMLWSHEHNRILGLPPQRLTGTWEQFLECIHPEDRAGVSEEIEKAVAAQADFAAEFRIVPKEKRVWVETIGRAFYDEAGRPVRMVGVVRDITERKQKEEENLQYLEYMAEHEQQTAILQERNRMAQEIHDSLAQGFTGIFIQLEAAEDALTVSPEALQEHIVRARELARSSLMEARHSVQALRPYALQQRSLTEALRHVVEQTTRGTAVRVVTKVEGEPFALSAPIEDHLLRIGQELLANALKHSQASRITLLLSFHENCVRLRVRDNGVGFSSALPPNSPPSEGGMGIKNIQERARLLGGTVKFWSRPEQGTRIEVQVPMVLSGDSITKNG